MERVIVLGLPTCKRCDSLIVGLTQEGIPFEFIDANKDTRLADRMESILKVDTYPMVIVEKGTGSVYLHTVDDIDSVGVDHLGYGTKVGCVSSDSMIVSIKKYIKNK